MTNSSVLTRALKLGRRAIPAPVRSKFRRWMFESLDLTWQAPSGIRVRIGRYMDWIVYNEIFVDGDYDQAIALALDASDGRRLHVIDVGANVGYFTLRAFDRLLERGMPRASMAVTAIEADPERVAEFESHVLQENGLRTDVRLIQGLAGRRTGAGMLCKDSWSNETARVPMPYVDISGLVPSASRIDLLKCDIEGAEEALIESYPELFAMTRVAVFEFHRDRCNVERCRALLREYGFVHSATRRPEADYSLCTLWR